VATVDLIYLVGGVLFLLLVVGVGLWALRFQSRQFPKGTKLTASESDAPGRLATKVTWLSGGRG
jgi:ABC-type transporter Mla subunit MlaD